MANKQSKIFFERPTCGASFSAKYCRELGVDPKAVLQAALDDLGVRHFRLMSYWDMHEPEQGDYDFSELDRQFDAIARRNANISLAVGLRQPRWPEVHQPEWAKNFSKPQWHKALNSYIITVVNRYKDHPALASWQLENEALNRGFGVDGEFSRKRLRTEMNLLRMLDARHPVIMSTSNTWGIPIRRPRPDVFGFTLYRRTYHKGRYRDSPLRPGFYRLRAFIITLITRRPCFIHELQAEPWGPTGTQDMSPLEQSVSMNATLLIKNYKFARKTKLLPADFWGLEWWYERKNKGDDTLWSAAQDIFQGKL